MAQNRSNATQIASKLRERRAKFAKYRAGKRAKHPVKVYPLRTLCAVDPVQNSQGKPRGSNRKPKVLSTPRVRKSRSQAKKMGLDAQQVAMKCAAEDYRLGRAVAPGSDEALARAQKRRSEIPLISLFSCLTKQETAKRFHKLHKLKVWYKPHGLTPCKKIPVAYILKVQIRRKSPNVAVKNSQAWVMTFCGKKVYCVESKNVFVTYESLMRRGFVGARAERLVQKKRVEQFLAQCAQERRRAAAKKKKPASKKKKTAAKKKIATRKK